MRDPEVNRDLIEAWYLRLQQLFGDGIEALDGEAAFTSESWDRPAGGGGRTRVMAGGRHIEKAAVNFAAVWGQTPPGVSDRLADEASNFYATGVSIIVHPRNPHAPTFHANLRYFETDTGAAWFGGGADLTPCYLYDEDAFHFHGVLRRVCNRHEVANHAAWKRWCDDYFHLRHRGEARGIGGVFFDHLTEYPEEVWAMQQDLGDHLLAAYIPILERRVDTPFGPEQVEWQELRRGRYVEFNLIWDRGTRFGIDTGGRTESILVSMPPRARWEYDHQPGEGTPEAELLELVRSAPRDWASEDWGSEDWAGEPECT